MALRRLTWACGVSKIVQAATVALPAVCLSAIGDEFHLDYAMRGILSSVRMGTLLSVVFVSGYLADRLGRRHFLWGAMVLIAAGLGATSGANSYALLLLAQALVGIGIGGLEALVNTLIAELNPKRSAPRLNLLNALFSAGLLVTAVATGAMLQSGVRWQTTFLVWPAIALVAAWLYAGRGYPRPHPVAGALGDVRSFLRNPLLWPLVVAMVMAGGAEAGILFWGANFVQQEMGASFWTGALIIGVCGGAQALGRLATGSLIPRVSPLTVMIVSAVGFAIATAGLCVAEGMTAAWILFGLGGLFIACFWPTILGVASDTIRVGSSTLFAILSAAGVGGAGLLPWVMGVVGDAAGLRAGVALLPASMVLEVAALLCFSRLIRPRDKGAAPASD